MVAVGYKKSTDSEVCRGLSSPREAGFSLKGSPLIKLRTATTFRVLDRVSPIRGGMAGAGLIGT